MECLFISSIVLLNTNSLKFYFIFYIMFTSFKHPKNKCTKLNWWWKCEKDSLGNSLTSADA